MGTLLFLSGGRYMVRRNIQIGTIIAFEYRNKSITGGIMALQPFLTTSDLVRIFQISERSARRWMAKLKDIPPSILKAQSSEVEHTRSKPFLAHSGLVMTEPGLTRSRLDAYIRNQLNVPLHKLMTAEAWPEKGMESNGDNRFSRNAGYRPRETQDAVLRNLRTKGWAKRRFFFEGFHRAVLCIERMMYFPFECFEEPGSGMKHIGITIFPVELLTGYYSEFFNDLFESDGAAGCIRDVFFDSAFVPELMGYFSRATGKRNQAETIVVVDDLCYGKKEGVTDSIIKLLHEVGKKVDRKRVLVFLQASLLPEGRDEITLKTGFQLLEGTDFFISGCIEKFREPRLKIRYHR